ncbi:iron-siderophore ABC transporter substrate-binding protein [Arthrobacter sp. JSM 101049]|uniref:iron-siderophore ABC transporter substrate-binding protein n=1 Tax=Arthrobacter sp. JSM 101049 TaxID=929097 RepID=UPI003561EBE3
MKALRPLAALATAALLLTGCGTTEAPTSGTGSDASASTAAEPISLTDARGKTVELDGPATRVVGTEWGAVENLVTLGVMPVGVADVKGYGAWVKSEPLDDSVTDIGTRGEPSFDTIASLDADLIVATNDLSENVIQQLEDLAPVMVVKSADASHQIQQAEDNLELVAEATGTEDQAEEAIAEYDAAVAEGKKALADAGLAGTRVAFADGWVADGQVSIRPYAKGSLLTDINTELGLVNAWTLKGDPAYGLAQTDVEGLTKIDADRFVYIANDVDADFTEALEDNAVWKSLPFVKSGNVYRLKDGIWMFGGPSSMTQYVKSLVASLTAKS